MVVEKDLLMVSVTVRIFTIDGVVKILHQDCRSFAYLLGHCKSNVVTMYLCTPPSIRFAFLKYEVFT